MVPVFLAAKALAATAATDAFAGTVGTGEDDDVDPAPSLTFCQTSGTNTNPVNRIKNTSACVETLNFLFAYS